ncbi:MAG TPA: LysM peptidoglycan-binding domain-containing protein [Steroidobacteraceae bacterium]|nr:LysM peptidoglycan-binding domain-containing protein [Steroidobacteraceae bacterium]
MVSNQVLGVRVVAGLLVLSGTLAGCASHRETEPAKPASQAVPVTAETTADSGEMTATEAAISTQPSTQVTAAPADNGPVINPTAPKSYTVKRGDTLWGIASMFLRDPWLWPEVWYINPQVANPHLIYPGDTLALAYGADGKPQIRLESGGAARLEPRLRSTPLDSAIPIISYQAIAAFLTRPSILTSDDVKHAPYVLAFRNDHEVAGDGNEIYVRNLNGPERARYSIVHVGAPLRDPDDGKVVGYQGVYTGTAIVSKTGEVSKAVLIDAARETLRGDKVMPAESDTPLNFTPSAPQKNIKGRIIAVVDGTDLIGQYQVVAINRGIRDGLINGNVLAIDRAGERIRDTYANGASFTRKAQDFGTSFARKVRLPDERTGLLIVFRTFDRVSYALVLGATDVIQLMDVVHNP